MDTGAQKLRALISWYCGFLICCALLGFLSGVASATTGLQFAAADVQTAGLSIYGFSIPDPNTILMTVAAALMASWAKRRGLTPFQNRQIKTH